MPILTIKATHVIAALAAVPFVWSAVAHAEPGPAAPDPIAPSPAAPDPSAPDPAAPIPAVATGDPRAECESPDVGGLWVDTGAPHAVCQYIVAGHFYYDDYDNGAYTGTLVYQDGAKVPTERPVLPETFQVPAGHPPLILTGPPS